MNKLENYVCDGQLAFADINMKIVEEYYTKSGKIKSKKVKKEKRK